MADKQHRAIVVGGSLAGLFAANILLREGWLVTLYERVDSGLDGRGAGIATHQELFDAMRHAGVAVDESIGLPVMGRTAFDLDGNELCHFAYSQILTSWTSLYRRLKSTFPASSYHLGRDVVEVVDDDIRPEVVFADGTRDQADLVVGADGTWSTIRAQCSPETKPRYAGYVAWRGLIPESAVTPSFASKYGPIHGFYTTNHHQLVHFAVTGADDSVEIGRRRFSFLWYLPYAEDSELPDLLTDVDGIRHPYSISPLKIRQRHIEKLHQDAVELLPPDFAATVCKTEKPFVQPIYDLVSDQMAFRRVVLVGDAAFVARPHVGAGVAKAGADVVALANALRSFPSIDPALKAFSTDRVRFGKAIVELSRRLGGYLAPTKDDQYPAPTVEQLIREVAMPLRLKA